MKVLISFISFFTVCYTQLPDTTYQDFVNNCLQTSNAYRAIHDAPALKWDNKLMGYAQHRCQQISQYRGLSAGHNGMDKDKQGNSLYGENISLRRNSKNVDVPCASAVYSWYKEAFLYNTTIGWSEDTGHFSQLVWKATTKVGCARCSGRKDGRYHTYVVCNYEEPGNMNDADSFEKNVWEP